MFYRVLSFVFVVVFSLSTNLYAGAGVLFTFDDGTCLPGGELRNNIKVWSDCGGGQDPIDGGDNRRTALREANEETAGTFKLTYNQVAAASSVIHNHHVGSYELFFVHLSGSKPSIQEIINNGRDAHGNLLPKVEKIDYKYVDAQALVNAAWGNGIMPGTNDPIFGPFIACIKKDTNNPMGALNTLINSPKKPAPIRPLPVKAAPPTPTVAPPAKTAAPRTIRASRRKPALKTRRVRKQRRVSRPRRGVRQQRRVSRPRRGVRQQRRASRPRKGVRQQRRVSRPRKGVRQQRRVSRRPGQISRRRRSR